jgi:hypothetical protein
LHKGGIGNEQYLDKNRRLKIQGIVHNKLCRYPKAYPQAEPDPNLADVRQPIGYATFSIFNQKSP